MTSIIGYKLISFILVVRYIDAQVTIVKSGMNDGTETFECGESLILTCQIDAYSFSMTWQNDSSPTPIAECVQSKCLFDQTSIGLFEFSYDINSGIFNLTIVQLTIDNNGTTYMCEDGSTSASAAITVDDYQPIVDESTYGKILVTSGCIDPNTDVKFEWKIVKADTEGETSYIPKGDALNITACLDDIICGPSYFVQRTESISVEPGGDYRLKVILTYDNKRRVESNPTNGTYKVEEQADVHDDEACDTGCIIGITVTVLYACFHIIPGSILIAVLCVRAKHKNKRCCTCNCNSKKGLLIVFSVIPLIGIVPVFVWLICCLGKTKSSLGKGKSPKSKTAGLPNIHEVNKQKQISDSVKRRGNKNIDKVLNNKTEVEAEAGKVSLNDVQIHKKEDNAKRTENNPRKHVGGRKSHTQAAKKHTIPGNTIVGDQSLSQTSDENQRRNRMKNIHLSLVKTTKQGSEHKTESPDDHSNSNVSGNASQGKEFPEKLNDETNKQNKNTPDSEGAPAGKANSHAIPVQNKKTTKQGSEHKSDSLEEHSNSTVSGKASQGIEYPEQGKDGTKKENQIISVSEETPTGKANSHKKTTKQGSEHKSDSLEEHSNSTVSGKASQGIEYPEQGKDGTKNKNKNIPVSEGTPTGNIESHVTLVTTKQGSEHKSDSLEEHSNSTVSGKASQGIEYPEKGKDGTKKQNKNIPASERTPTGLETQQTDLSGNFTDANDNTARVSNNSTNM